MTTRQAIRLRTNDPIIITANSASAEQGETLRHIPGAATWGALAARIYGSCDDPWKLFHSGALKISNAYPVLGGKVAWPAPLCLHYEKGQEATTGNAICLASGEWRSRGQPKQFRDGFVNAASGKLQNPGIQDAIKTAIDPKTGAAAEAQIFASAAIRAGQSFVFWMEGPEELVNAAVEGLGQNCFIGRSRSAEFGKVALEQTCLPNWPHGRQITGKTAYVWLLSDLCLSDEYGQPQLHPAQLGPQVTGEIDWEHSFLRFRNYWPYNGKWGSRALARQVITQGSVFRLEGAETLAGFTWIGEDNSTGSGLVYISDKPPLEAMGALTEFDVASCEAVNGDGMSSDLVAWLRRQGEVKAGREAAMDTAADLAGDILVLLENARDHPVNPGYGPTKTQINHLRNGVRQSLRGNDGWMDKLWGSTDKADADPAWGFLVARGQASMPLHQWMRDELESYEGDRGKLAALIKALELTAKRLDDRGDAE